MMMPRHCGNCRFCAVIEDVDEKETSLVCRRMPPVIVSRANEDRLFLYSEYPRVVKSDWCGEHVYLDEGAW